MVMASHTQTGPMRACLFNSLANLVMFSATN